MVEHTISLVARVRVEDDEDLNTIIDDLGAIGLLIDELQIDGE